MKQSNYLFKKKKSTEIVEKVVPDGWKMKKQKIKISVVFVMLRNACDFKEWRVVFGLKGVQKEYPVEHENNSPAN